MKNNLTWEEVLLLWQEHNFTDFIWQVDVRKAKYSISESLVDIYPEVKAFRYNIDSQLTATVDGFPNVKGWPTKRLTYKERHDSN